jgi:probable phosphoglycerate mutase
VAVFSHGYAIRLLLATVQGLSLAQVGDTPHGGNTAVSLLKWENGALHCVFRDDDSHLHTGPAADAGQCGRPSALESGLCFGPLRLPEQTDFFLRCVRGSWSDERPFDRDRLLTDAADSFTLVGESRGKPVGVLQLRREGACGRIRLYCVEPELRCRGYGVQLLGQAVEYCRARKLDALTLALAPDNEVGRRFFTGYGFAAAGTPAGDGGEQFSKDLRYPQLRAKVIID